MNKQSILDAVSQALDAMGLTDMGGDEFDEQEGMEGQGNAVPIWSQLQAGTLGSTNGPIHDRQALMQSAVSAGKPQGVDPYGMPVDDEGAEMMSALGLV